MPGDRVTVQNLLDLVERNRLTTDKMSEAMVETAQSMEKVAGEIGKLREAQSVKNDKRETLLLRLMVGLIGIICLFAGVRAYDALEKSATKASRIAAPIYEEAPRELPPPPP